MRHTYAGVKQRQRLILLIQFLILEKQQQEKRSLPQTKLGEVRLPPRLLLTLSEEPGTGVVESGSRFNK